MADFLSIIFVIVLIALPISIAKPQIFSKFFNATRTKNSLILGGILAVLFVLIAVTAPAPTKDSSSADQTQNTIAPTQTVEVSEKPTIAPISQAPSPTPTPTSTPVPTKKPTPVPTKIVTPTATKVPLAYPTSTPAPQKNNETGGAWVCDCSKTCPNISSCAEAQYLLNSCGCSARDGDNDGIACDGAPLRCQN